MMKKLIVGLGNPGGKYERTRHNLGARVALAGDGFVLTTFMNNSGQEVAELMRKNGLKSEDVLIIYDDVELLFGAVRLQQGGSAKGHNGVRSVIDYLKTDNFFRLRLGIGRPEDSDELEKFVLGRFTSEEEERIPEMIERAKEIIGKWIDPRGRKLFRNVGTKDD